MATNNQDSIDNAVAPHEYSRGYKLIVRFQSLSAMRKTSSSTKKKDWLIKAEFWCHDLLHVMRHSLFWTTSNVVPESSYIADNTIGSTLPLIRVWELREYANKSKSQCRWTATFKLYAHSVNQLADVRLSALRQENISSAEAWNTMDPPRHVFQYYHPKSTSGPKEGNINCWIEDLHPAHGSWWFFPMEMVPDYDKIDFKKEVMERGSLI
jgi:hypothetical protein